MGFLKKIAIFLILAGFLLLGLAYWDLNPHDLGRSLDQASKKETVQKPLSAFQHFVWVKVPEWARKLRRLSLTAKEDLLPRKPGPQVSQKKGIKEPQEDQLTGKDRRELDQLLSEENP